MLCPPEELLQKNQAVSNSWHRYRAEPSFESFVELAVSINSFTEFLIDKGIAALHHASHQLEQVTLALFNREVGHPLPQTALDDLSERVGALARMTHAHATATAGLIEHCQDTHHASPASVRVGQTWLIAQDRADWAGLEAQLGYFGMAAGFVTWDQDLPDSAGVAPLLLLDMSSLPENEWRTRIQALRQRFGMGQLICLGVRSDFEQLQQALSGGCDSCLLEGTPPHAIIEHIMENPGDNKAADRKVRMQAAQALLGEGRASGPNTNISIGVAGGGSQPLRAGVVIRLKTNAPQAPIEAQEITEA